MCGNVFRDILLSLLMKTQSPLLISLLSVVVLSLTACLGTNEDLTEGIDDTSHPLITHNALSTNGITANGITANGLSTNGITKNTTLMSALQSPETGAYAQEFLSYVVSCALPPSATVSLKLSGRTVKFPGELNLAPQWASGTCDQKCQEIVSACLMSRVNHLGHHIDISMRGSPSISSTLATSEAERAAFPKEEATYFGNLFGPKPKLFACTSATHPELIDRVCGSGQENHDSCVVEILGTCDDALFDGESMAICDSQDATAGYWSGCKDTSVKRWYRSITIFRANSDQDNPDGAL